MCLGAPVKDSVLAAFIPVGLGILMVLLVLLPRSFLTPFSIWIAAELFLGLAFLDFYYLTRKYKIGRQTIVFFAALITVILIVLSYVPFEVQILAYIITAMASILMYARIVVEFRRRKYT